MLIDAAEELRLLEYGQRLEQRSRNVLAVAAGASTGRSMFEASLAGGWQALQGAAAGADTGTGLRTGAWLDLVSLLPGDAALAGRYEDEILDSWIFCGGRSSIDCVWRAGVKVVAEGRHRERERLLARYTQALRRLRA